MENSPTMAANHTPGPWRQFWNETNKRTRTGNWYFVSRYGESDQKNVPLRSGREAEANARLIAAAPAMYEMLTQVVDDWPSLTDDDDDQWDDISGADMIEYVSNLARWIEEHLIPAVEGKDLSHE